MKALGIAAIFGLAVILLIWGLHDYLAFRFRRDSEWIEQTALRFTPTPVNVRRWTIGYYVSFCLLLAVLIFTTPHPIFGICFWFVLLAVPRIVVEMLWVRRRREIDQQLPAAITSMSNSLRAGLTLVQAMQRLADNAPEPIRTDFRVMANRYAFGASLEATIREAKERIASPNFNLFASALLLNREMGGDVSETLTRISKSLEKLHQMRQTVEAHTSEGRTNIKVLLVAPVLLLLMMSTADAEAVKLLFTTSQGYAILLVAGAFITAGVYFAAKVSKPEI